MTLISYFAATLCVQSMSPTICRIWPDLRLAKVGGLLKAPKATPTHDYSAHDHRLSMGFKKVILFMTNANSYS